MENDEDNIKDDLKKIGTNVEKIIEKIDDLAKSTVTSKEETGAGGELYYTVMYTNHSSLYSFKDRRG